MNSDAQLDGVDGTAHSLSALASQSKPEGKYKPSAWDSFCLGLGGIFFLLFALAFVIVIVRTVLQEVDGVAWWPLGDDGTALLALGTLICALCVMGATMSLPTEEEYRDRGEEQPTDGALTLRLFSTCLLHSAIVLFAWITVGMVVGALR